MAGDEHEPREQRESDSHYQLLIVVLNIELLNLEP
jgi:hypothetical protein